MFKSQIKTPAKQTTKPIHMEGLGDVIKEGSLMDAIYQDQRHRRESIMKRKKTTKGATTVEGAFKEISTKVKQRKNESLYDAKQKVGVEPLKLDKLEGYE